MRALVTGATGFVGRALVASLLGDGGEVNILTRDVARAGTSPGVTAHAWDPVSGPAPAAAFRTASGPVEVVFNLAGEPVAEGRWNHEKKRRIVESRVVGTNNLIAAIASLPASDRPRALVSASAVGFYGSRGDEILDESAAAGEDFLADVCRDWEEAAMTAEPLGLRVATLRIGVVLGRGGGAPARMLTPFKMGAGGRLGDGKQWMPWVHLDDIVGLLRHLAATDSLKGAVNGVGPNVVTNREFTKSLGAALHRPAIFPVPRLALRLAFGDVAEVLVSSQRAVPKAAEASGYRFRYTTLDAALAAILPSKG